MSTRSNSKGFCLTNFIIIIAILGVLVAMFAPKVLHISADSQAAATAGVAGILDAANSENYTSRTSNSAKGQAISNCQDVGKLLQGGLPSGYTIASLPITTGTTVSCTVTGPNGASGTFSATGIS